MLGDACAEIVHGITTGFGIFIHELVKISAMAYYLLIAYGPKSAKPPSQSLSCTVQFDPFCRWGVHAPQHGS